MWTELAYDERHEKWRMMLFFQYRELVEAATKLSVTENKRKGERFRPGSLVSSCKRAVEEGPARAGRCVNSDCCVSFTARTCDRAPLRKLFAVTRLALLKCLLSP